MLAHYSGVTEMRILSSNLNAIVNKRKVIAASLIAFVIGILVCGALLNLSQIVPYFSVSGEPLLRFSSYRELVDFVGSSSSQPYYFVNEGDVLDALAQAKGAESNRDYSTTNVQVAGVDEADTVKSYEGYLYVVSNQSVFIMKAYPPEDAKIVSEIKLNETLHGIFINGNRLVVLGSNACEVRILVNMIEPNRGEPSYMSYATPNTFIKVYDITNKASPVSTRNVTLDGYYFSSRMIGNFVYTIINEPVLLNGTNVKLPAIFAEGETVTMSATDIYYSGVTDYGFTFTTIFAVNAVDDAEKPTHETILLGTTRTIYVSSNSIYIAFSGEVDSATGAEKTLIYRIHIDGGNIENKASGGVPGGVLNQFSMDEYDGYLRIATTTNSWDREGVRNNVYVLNMNLGLVGKLENLALKERIYSARFMGDRCYLVTFQQVDPFFVIDLSSPGKPEVSGYLKIPGFSSYLHPYDESHIIGIGKEGDNVKMSLFDVTNVTAPTETAHFAVQGEWSDSTVLWDHKAFLFNKTRHLLAIPVVVNVAEVVDDYYYTWSYWQGVYIFDVSLEHGFVLRGNVTHQESTTSYLQYGYEVQRILYIGNVLYTMSDRKVMMNSLETLEQIGEIALP